MFQGDFKMLVLTRKVGERLIFGKEGEIVLEIVEIRNGKNIRIGIEAPKDIPVFREEVWEQIKKKKLE